MNARDYDRRRLQHQPTDEAEMAAELRRLSGEGYTSRDIANALRLDRVHVERLLQHEFHTNQRTRA